MSNLKRQAILERIKSSIDTHGYHVRVVEGGPLPRFAYTIGLHGSLGFEVVIAGGAFFKFDEMLQVVNEIARVLLAGAKLSSFEVGGLGQFSLHEVDESWGQRLLLAALDYYGIKHVTAFQIIPDKQHLTIDTPDMSESWTSASQPIWRWLDATWAFPVSSKSVAITNLDALRGRSVTEVMRWEANQWELFAGAGPDVEQTDIRTVPIGVLIGYDPSLDCVVNLDIGSGLWRENKDHAWHVWGKR